ncbi:MAG TPA: TRAP transporter small permease [Bacillota bacterium]|mgnify:CR=1 FL=1|nr:TRAP transporter small permease [Bacillota bacterium]HOA15143.1 TRAP transporter small permease [Bacillota bacterium]HOG52935.1 TRAP transporter small permease [Bacillota bacterium]
MRVFNWLYENLHKLVEAFIVLTVALMVLDVVVGVFARYVLNNAIHWVEEASRYMMIWMAYLAMGMVIREEGNISVTFMVNWFPPAIRRIIKVLGLLVIGFFLTVLFRESVKYMRILRIQTSPALGLPMIFPYMAVTVGAALMFIDNLVLLFAYVTGKKPV